MGEVLREQWGVFLGRVYEAKDNMVVETRTGPDSVSLSVPIDFVDGMLREYVDEEVRITISVKIQKV